ncbi:hypothetical protein BJ170DRAFT_399730 [Xylariales sp. AK1849]|nr:hypothetical protein BJ170DRAFT_399730 [Xylariales sp. AK1849]
MESAALSGKRPAKSLRTYSRRTTSDGNPEPPRKRQRRNNSNTGSKSESPPQLPKQMHLRLPPPPVPNRGSILTYFEVRSSSSSTTSRCEQLSEPALPSSTPPSSPPRIQALRKKPRRLTTKPIRAAALPEYGLAVEETSDPILEEARGWEGNEAVREPSISSLNRQSRSEEDRRDTGNNETSKRQKFKQAAVQTTLSLSLTEKQFIECKDCNMLYNPYHDSDVRLHARRHAVILRAKKAAGSD